MDERGWRVNSVVTVANHLTTTGSVKVHRAVGFSGLISYRIARLCRLHPRGARAEAGSVSNLVGCLVSYDSGLQSPSLCLAVARRIERAVNPLADDEGAVRAVAEDDDVYAAFWGYAQGDHSREHVIRVVLAALDRYLAGE